MSSLTRFLHWFDLNAATLSGAVDIIVVRHDDGTLTSTPWHCRIGALQVLQPGNKKISVRINGTVQEDVQMEIGHAGEAFFTTTVVGAPPSHLPYARPLTEDAYLVSPVSSPQQSPVLSKEEEKDLAALQLDADDASPATAAGAKTAKDAPLFLIDGTDVGTGDILVHGQSQAAAPRGQGDMAHSDEVEWAWGKLPMRRSDSLSAFDPPAPAQRSAPSTPDMDSAADPGEAATVVGGGVHELVKETHEALKESHESNSKEEKRSILDSLLRLVRGKGSEEEEEVDESEVGKVGDDEDEEERLESHILNLLQKELLAGQADATLQSTADGSGVDALAVALQAESLSLVRDSERSLIVKEAATPVKVDVVVKEAEAADIGTALLNPPLVSAEDVGVEQALHPAKDLVEGPEERELLHLREADANADDVAEPDAETAAAADPDQPPVTVISPVLARVAAAAAADDGDDAEMLSALSLSNGDVSDGSTSGQNSGEEKLDDKGDDEGDAAKAENDGADSVPLPDPSEGGGELNTTGPEGEADQFYDMESDEELMQPSVFLSELQQTSSSATLPETLTSPEMTSQIDILHDFHLDVSLCGDTPEFTSPDSSPESRLLAFDEHRLRFGGVVDDISLIFSDKAMFRFHANEKDYLQWDAVAPMLVSLLAFRRPLPEDVMQNWIARKDKSSKDSAKRGWLSGLFRGRSAGSDTSESSKKDQQRATSKSPTSDADADGGETDKKADGAAGENDGEAGDADGESADDDAAAKDDGPIVYTKRTLKPTHEMLESFNLHKGENEVEFSVSSSLQGTRAVRAKIWLLEPTTKIVISDIDGTITKSDVLGQLLPQLGRDWSHKGVAKLYRRLHENGYQILYLTSRAIGQSEQTRNYLKSVNQDGVTLPPGPVFLSPDRLLASFTREVIHRKPEEFKIRCLSSIRDAFPGDGTPFFAGFGNRVTDYVSYKAVEIPDAKVFVINHSSEIRQQHVNVTYCSSYPTLFDSADLLFPPIRKQEADFNAYNDFNFWRTPRLPLSGLELDEE